MTAPHDPAPPLWKQLQAVAEVLASIRRGVSGNAALQAVHPSIRPGVQALSFQVLRVWGQAQALRDVLVSRPAAPDVDALLCVALALGAEVDRPRYDAHTWVHQSVEAAKRARHLRPHAGFINACLRRFLRERDALLAQVQANDVAHWNHPAWWIQRLRQDYPADWTEILRANQTQPSLTLRVNQRQISPQAYLEQLKKSGIDATAFGTQGIRLTRPMAIAALPGYEQGWFSVQDAAAQWAAPLLLQGMPRGSRVLDACAAPGGKTAHLLEILDCEVTAVDMDPQRCQRITENLTRLRLHADIHAADAADPAAWWDGRAYDAILLDAPCSASGIVRRHPDVRWLRRPTDIRQLAELQVRLLSACWGLLRPGGRLLYSTCSVFHAEGQDQIEAFLAHNRQACLLPSPGHLLPQSGLKATALPDNAATDHDGFYYALLEKMPD